MKVTQEKLPKSQLGLEIEIPAETTKKVYEKVVQNLARSANIPGFRKGKVPRQILLQRLGPGRIKEAALEDLVQNSLRDALSQETIE
ncbi:MAG: trigger factor family protein, partial [Coleofasciculus sp. C2-GNP5-27]